MHRLIRSALSLAAIAALTACSHGNSPQDAGPTACSTLAECGGNQVCLNSACVNICHATSECQTSATPTNVCEEGVCLAPACGNDAQCGSGQVCLNGKCAQKPVASQVASCDVTPNPGTVRAGSTLQMTALAKDSDGAPLHFSGTAWATSSGSIAADGTLTAPNTSGDITVTATAGTKTCTSTIHVYGAAIGLRVTAINMQTKEPIKGAKVVVCDHTGACAAAVATADDGTFSTTSFDAASHDVHVFAPGYNYTSFVQTTATDLLVPLQPFIATNSRSGFTSHLCVSKSDDPACPSPQGEFAPLQDQGEAVHMAFFGSAVPNSLLDLSVSTLVGPMHTVHLSLPGTTTAKDLDLPYGLVLGIATNFFGTNDPHVFADGGIRSLWGIGGNINLSKVVGVLTPLLDPNATIDVGKLLPQLLGFFGKLEAGAVVGVKAPVTPPGGTPTFTPQPIQLTTPMRLRYDVTSPPLPQLDGTYVDGVLVVAGSMNYPLGFIPLGMTAGLSAKDGHGGVVDSNCDPASNPCDPNVLHVKFAPENGGTEGSPAAIALLALNFGGLTPGSMTKIAISGQINAIANGDLAYTSPDKAAPKIPASSSFMKLPASGSIVATISTRNVTITGDADPGVQIYRFELANAARLNWEFWLPPVGAAGSRNFHLPDPGFSAAVDCNAMITLCDPFADAKADDGSTHGPGARLLALELTSPSTTAAQLETFSNPLRLDELGTALKAFTALQVSVNQ